MPVKGGRHSDEMKKHLSEKAKTRDHSHLIACSRIQAEKMRGTIWSESHRKAVEAGYVRRRATEEAALINAGEKACSKCARVLPFDQFSKNKSCLLGLTKTCKPCRVIQTKAWSLANPEKVKAFAREAKARKYGITLKHRNDIYAKQGGTCAICRAIIEIHGRGTHIDHCHATGVVRGLLCHLCNQGLGLFKDDADALLRASEYIVRSKAAHLLR